MSTTTKREVALGYMNKNGTDTMRILFELRMGMVDRGANVAELSQFPEEAEILFAPLTGLEVIETPKTNADGVDVYQLRLSCNLRDQTIEEVILSSLSYLIPHPASLALPTFCLLPPSSVFRSPSSVLRPRSSLLHVPSITTPTGGRQDATLARHVD